MRGIIQARLADGTPVVLPLVSPARNWPPRTGDKEAWTTHFEGRIEREGSTVGLQEAIAWEWRGEHPYVLQFLHDMADVAIERSHARKQPMRDQPHWLEWRSWSRPDFVKAVTWDKKHGGRGGKAVLAHRCLTTSSPLYRRWQKVAPGEPWPAGNKGPLGP